MMPGSIRKRGNDYIVTWGRRRFKHSSKAKARRQLNLLRGIKHGWHPTGRKARR